VTTNGTVRFGSPVAEAKEKEDAGIAPDGEKEEVEGYRNFSHSFLQPAPLLFTRDHHPLWLGDLYRGRSAFLIAGGPSFATLNHSLLRKPGVLTLGLNNSAKTFRPNLWVGVDEPDQFMRSVWLDPTILKFVPFGNASKLSSSCGKTASIGAITRTTVAAGP